jgi:putative tryptophan/tyrosine transport system substrate-binding protein
VAHHGKILQGLRQPIFPVERPTRFEMVINLKTAKALGLNLAISVLLRADVPGRLIRR